MAFIPSRSSDPLGLNLTPLIDVVFQLLIFFVCVSTWSYVQIADQEGMDLPAPIQSAHSPTAEERPRLIINLRADGTILIAGKVLPPERLAPLMQTATQQHGDRLEVLVRAHRQAPYAKTQEVFRACTEGGIREVRFAVLRERV